MNFNNKSGNDSKLESQRNSKISNGVKKEKNDHLWSMLGLAWEMGYMIALPLVGLAVIGRFIDKKIGASPLFLLIGIGLAIIISTVLVVRKTKEALEKAENDKDDDSKT